ncbi:oviduct-specific glycoprotein-like isoform X2 [Pteropus medius]|uniref:oviduct-specific glycoprotein-like isoform X2 n=1 Tax=Pteropus vampyrus TaxID=132908 RepID=UPI00196A2D94|nr:oviduct-specific glycoprotein-like isoform X2 [Pteropus giganteus]
MEKEAPLSSRPRPLLSAAVSGDRTSSEQLMMHLERLLDFVNALSYDLHGSWEKVAGHNSPCSLCPETPNLQREKERSQVAQTSAPEPRPLALAKLATERRKETWTQGSVKHTRRD